MTKEDVKKVERIVLSLEEMKKIPTNCLIGSTLTI